MYQVLPGFFQKQNIVCNTWGRVREELGQFQARLVFTEDCRSLFSDGLPGTGMETSDPDSFLPSFSALAQREAGQGCGRLGYCIAANPETFSFCLPLKS